MRNIACLTAIAALLAGCGSTEETTPAVQASEAATDETVPVSPSPEILPEPDLAACPKAQQVDEGLRGRTGPLALPPMFDGLAKSGMDHIAVLTLDGGTVCVDASWFEQVSSAKVTRDKRFLSFEWGGYEAFGYVVVDRAGKGTVIETGNAPVTSPDGKRLASIDLSVSGFGGLNAFGIWQVEPDRLRQLAGIEEGFPPGDWTVKGWSGNNCVNLALLPIDRDIGSAEEFESAPRDPWNASEARGWKPAPGSCPQV